MVRFVLDVPHCQTVPLATDGFDSLSAFTIAFSRAFFRDFVIPKNAV
jgi:hypothetical protein